MFSKLDKKSNIYFFESLEDGKRNPIRLKINPVVKKYDGYLNYTLLNFEIEIVSSGKAYKLNNCKLYNLLTYYEVAPFVIGKAYTYDPKTDYFQGWEKELVDFLKEMEEVAHISDLDNLLKSKKTFDRFIDILAKGKQVELKEVKLKELLEIEAKEEKGNISIEFIGVDRFMQKGAKTLVDYSDKEVFFYRLSELDMERYRKILIETSRESKILIRQENLTKVINSVQGVGTLRLSEELEEKIYTPKKIEEKIYIDSYNLYGLRVYTKLFYDGKSKDEFENQIIIENLPIEKSLYLKIIEEYVNNIANGNYHITDVENIYNFVIEGIPKLEKNYEVYYSESFKNKNYSRAVVRVESKIDKLLEIKFSIDGVEPGELLKILESIREKKKYFLLKNGGILDIKDRELEKLNDLIDVSEATKSEIEQGIIKRARNYTYFLKSTLKNIKNILLDDEFNKMEKKLESILDKTLERKIKDKFKMLRDYQIYGVQWLLTLKRLGLGGVLADDMGLGKTLQTIAYLSFEERELPSIIVTPKSLAHNWKNEFEKFNKDAEVKMCVGTKKEREEIIKNLKPKDILITTYGVLKNDIEFYKKMSESKGFANIIIDEAQNIKNILGKTSSSIKEIIGETKIALTGTPIENNILELWSIFDFAFPGYLGKHTTFKKRYLDNLKSLKEIVNPFILRRTKDEVLRELPEKIEQDIVVELSDKQKKLYLSYLERYKQEIETDKQDAIKILSCLTRLRQICNHPKIFLEDYKGDSGKVNALLELLSEAKSGGHRVLLFSQFTEMLSLIKKELKDEYEVLYLDGKTKIGERLNLVERFNNGEGDIFIISLKAGGSGLNLTGADTVIHFDPWWNPSIENQATDRAHRMGQKKVVNVFKLITKGTIEEKINLIKDEKAKVISEVLDGKTKELLKMNKDELLKLF